MKVNHKVYNIDNIASSIANITKKLLVSIKKYWVNYVNKNNFAQEIPYGKKEMYYFNVTNI